MCGPSVVFETVDVICPRPLHFICYERKQLLTKCVTALEACSTTEYPGQAHRDTISGLGITQNVNNNNTGNGNIRFGRTNEVDLKY